MEANKNYAYFYNSDNGDRVYDADSMTDWLLPFFTTGVFDGDLQVIANDDMTVSIAGGYCNIKGKVKHFWETTTFDLETASGTLNRIDNVILRRDDTERDIYLMIQKGGNAQKPTAPEITRNDTIYDLKLAEIYIKAGTITITQANITDKRMDANACGWVASTVKEINLTQISAQFETFSKEWFEENARLWGEWFEEIKGQLSEDAAGNLQNQIGRLTQLSTDNKNNIVSAINEMNSKKASNVDLQVERARIDNLTKLPSGSTSGDAELQDIRVGANGVTYKTAGAAVREQVSQLSSEIDYHSKTLKYDYIKIEQGGWNSNTDNMTWVENEDTNRLKTNFFPTTELIDNGGQIDVYANDGYEMRCIICDMNYNPLLLTGWGTHNAFINSERMVKICVRKVDNSDILPDTFWDAVSCDRLKNLKNIYDISSLSSTQECLFSKENYYQMSNNARFQYYDANGGITENSSWCTTEKMPFNQQEEFFYSGLTNLGTKPYTVFYDNYGNVVGSFRAKTGNDVKITNIPNTAKYIAFSIFKDDIFNFNYYKKTDVKIDNFVEKNTNYNLNINLTGKEDMIWSWWYYPQVVSFKRVRDKIYWGYTTNKGYTGVAEYDKTTGLIRKTHLKQSDIDDHNALSLVVMDDGTIMCAYAGGHGTDEAMHIRLSKTPESIEFFHNDIVLKSSGKTTYGQIVRCGIRYYLFYRVDNAKWCYRSTTDGTSWTEEKTLVSSNLQYYCKIVPTTTDGLLRICMYSNPGSTDSNIRMGFFDTSTGNILNADATTVLGNDNISYSDFDIIIPIEDGKTQRMFDVAITEPSKPLILYAPFSTSMDSVYKLYDTGNVVTVCNGGQALWNPKYQDGAAFIGTNRIVAGRGYEGRDNIELFEYNGNDVALLESIYSETKGEIPIRNARPIVDINGTAILWHRGYYNADSYTDFNTDAILKMLEKVT